MNALKHFTRKISLGMSAQKSVETAIRAALSEQLEPVHLEVVNESYMHNAPPGSESHFKVLVVTEKFVGLPLIKRHRMVNNVVKEKLSGGFVHALSIEAQTPKEWQPDHKMDPSPDCRGGFGK